MTEPSCFPRVASSHSIPARAASKHHAGATRTVGCHTCIQGLCLLGCGNRANITDGTNESILVDDALTELKARRCSCCHVSTIGRRGSSVNSFCRKSVSPSVRTHRLEQLHSVWLKKHLSLQREGMQKWKLCALSWYGQVPSLDRKLHMRGRLSSRRGFSERVMHNFSLRQQSSPPMLQPAVYSSQIFEFCSCTALKRLRSLVQCV